MLPFSYVAPSKAEAKIKAAKVVANGGRPMVWNMPCAPDVNQKGISGIRDVFELVSANQGYFKKTIFDKFAGIVVSSKSVRVYCQGDTGRLQEYRATIAGAYEIMIRNHLPHDFLLDEHITFDTLKKYKVILLPNVVHLEKEQCNQIRKYVKPVFYSCVFKIRNFLLY